MMCSRVGNLLVRHASVALFCTWLAVASASHAAVPSVPTPSVPAAVTPYPSVPEGALAADVVQAGEPRVRARLLVHPDDDPDAGPVRVGVHLEIAPGWHVYWRNPGETGLPTRVRFEVEEGSVGPVRWPAPEVFEEADGLLTTFGYTRSVLLTASADLAASHSRRSSRLGARVDLLACRTQCVPGTFSLERTLASGLRENAANAERVRALFAESESRLPVTPASLGARVEVRYDRAAILPGEAFRAQLALRSCVAGSAGRSAACPALVPARSIWSFLPADDAYALAPAASGEGAAEPGTFSVEISGTAPERPPRKDERMRGLLAVRDETGRPHALEVDLPLPRAAAGEAVSSLGPAWRDGPPAGEGGATAGRPGGVLRALLLGLLGGLVLNLMPCVLPVLAIKVCAVAEMARHSRREVAVHGAAYTAGVLLSMWALAGVVIALRAAGSLVGWGFQFQEPLFVLGVCTVVVAFALNLFGVFEIGGPAGRITELGTRAVGWRRSLFEGLLAVVLATPCTAPFLGTAVGFAFAGSWPVILAVFSAVGLGLALPFAAVSMVPRFGRFVPRAGAWMLHVRSGLGFALLGSALWLIWIAGRSLGVDGVVQMLAFLVAVAFGIWAFGQAQRAGRTRFARGLALGLVAFVLAGPLIVRLEPASAAVAAPVGGDHRYEVYDPDALARELAAGRPAFVIYTADWCLTCKVNEKAVIADEEIQEALARFDVAVFRADWTRRDEGIRAELARFGRAGVPLYLVYAPGRETEPVMLPELLTVDRLRSALEEAATAATARAGT